MSRRGGRKARRKKNLLAELPTLNSRTTEELTVLLLGHALAALLNH